MSLRSGGLPDGRGLSESLRKKRVACRCGRAGTENGRRHGEERCLGGVLHSLVSGTGWGGRGRSFHACAV